VQQQTVACNANQGPALCPCRAACCTTDCTARRTALCTAQVADPSDKIGNWNENYWLLRAEPIPAEEQEVAEGDVVICVAHIAGMERMHSASGVRGFLS
jgi:hypothetical protein